jgi:hypothetical protein
MWVRENNNGIELLAERAATMLAAYAAFSGVLVNERTDAVWDELACT